MQPPRGCAPFPPYAPHSTLARSTEKLSDLTLSFKVSLMPHIPMPPGSDAAAYKKNTTEQYESLGRFVEAFERMVHEVRESSVALIERDGKHARLIEVALHHQALTAKPLFDIFRALIIEIIDDAIRTEKDEEAGIIDGDPPLLADAHRKPRHFTIKERDTYLGALAALAAEFEDLANRRNELLHATWFVGFVDNDDPNASEFYARKYKTTKAGLTPIDLPKSASQLKDLSTRCEDATNWVAWLHSCIAGEDCILDRFQPHAKKWWLIWPNGAKTTFPEKPS
jgi:hypothetical protein